MLHLALIQKNLGNQEQAIEAYKRVITDAPTSEEAKVAADDLKSMYAERENSTSMWSLSPPCLTLHNWK